MPADNTSVTDPTPPIPSPRPPEKSPWARGLIGLAAVVVAAGTARWMFPTVDWRCFAVASSLIVPVVYAMMRRTGGRPVRTQFSSALSCASLLWISAFAGSSYAAVPVQRFPADASSRTGGDDLGAPGMQNRSSNSNSFPLQSGGCFSAAGVVDGKILATVMLAALVVVAVQSFRKPVDLRLAV